MGLQRKRLIESSCRLIVTIKRLSEMPEVEALHLRRIECPTYEDTPPLAGKPLAMRRVAVRHGI